MVFNPDSPNEHEEVKHKDNHIYKNILEEWFEKRFGRKPSVDESYFEEWKERFNSDRFESCMDDKSKRIWREVVRERLRRADEENKNLFKEFDKEWDKDFAGEENGT